VNNPLIVITDPSDQSGVPSDAPLQLTFVAFIGALVARQSFTVVVAVQFPLSFPVAAVATTVYVGPSVA
jgi:hypothetical protein